MAARKEDIQKLIQQDRKDHPSQSWEGGFLDYLELVRQGLASPKLAHARLHEMITEPGSHEILESEDPKVKRLYQEDPVQVYHFFQEEFFGIEGTVSQIVRYFRSAALKGEESRQVLYLMGPVGSGKSSLVQKIKCGLEQSGELLRHSRLPHARRATAPGSLSPTVRLRGHAGCPH